MAEPKEKTSRRGFLRVAGGTVVGLAAGGALGYLARQPAVTPGMTTVTETVTAGGPTAPTTPQATTAEQTFIQVEQHDPNEADPARWVDFVSPWTFTYVYDALAAWSSGTEGYTGQPSMKPMLARRWIISPDKKTYDFELRQGVYFHDGNLMTADDVVYTLKRMLAFNDYPAATYSDVLPPDNVVKLDKYTLRATLTKPFPLFIQFVPFMYILSQKTLEANIQKPGPYGDMGDYATNWLQTHDAGAGPYVMTERVIGDHVSYQRFKDYWGGFGSKGVFESGIYKIVPEASTQIQMLKTGDADRIGAWLPVATYAQLRDEAKQAGSNFKVDIDTALEFYLTISWNNQAKGLDNVHVRRALSYAFDYDKCVNDIFKGMVERLEGPVPKGVQFFNPDITMYEFDLSKAKDELEQSPYKPGDPVLNFNYMALLQEDHRRNMGLLLADGAKEIGITINTVDVPYATFEKQWESVDTANHMVAIIPMSAYPDPDNYLYVSYHSKFWKGKTGYVTQVFVDNPTVNDLLDKARFEADDNTRRDMYYQIQKILTDDATALWAVKGEPNFNVMRNDIGGFEWMPFGTPPNYIPNRFNLYKRLTSDEMPA
jgi:peptide/nickel transport system substrate-binding protein